MSERNRPAREPQAEADGVIEGRNAVTEALRTGTVIDKIFILKGETDSSLGHIASTARARGIVVVDADKRKLDRMSVTHAHQGVIALCAVREYASVDDILAAAREKGEAPLIVVCDELSDPHNLGAVIRTACCAGAHGVIIPKRPAQATQGGGRLDLRHRHERHHLALLRRPEGARRHRHRQRGLRHEPPGRPGVRLHCQHSHEERSGFSERLRRRGHPALRGRAAENELTQTVSFSPLFKEPYISCLETVKNRIMNSTP